MISRWLKLGAGVTLATAAALLAGCAIQSNQNTAQGFLAHQYSNVVDQYARAVGRTSGPVEASTPAEAPIRLVFTPAPGSTVSPDEVPVFEIDPSWPRQLPQGWNWWRTPGDTSRAGAGSDVLGIRTDKNDHVWVTNRGAIAEYDPAGSLLQVWDARRPDGTGRSFGSIHGMFVDNDGFVWTMGRENHVIMKFTPNGKLAMLIGTYDETGGSNDRTRLGRPAELWMDTISKELFVADGYTNHRLIVFDGETGQYLRHWGADGLAPCDLPGGGRGAAGSQLPGGGTVPPAGRAGNTPAAAAGAAAPAAAGAGAGATGGRAGAAAGAGGAAGGRGGAGRGAAAAGGGPGCPNLQYSTPHGIVGSRDGLIYISDRQNSRVQVFDHLGNFKGSAWTREGTGGAFSIALSPDPAQRWIYVTDGTGHRIWILQRSDLQVVGSFSKGGGARGEVGRPHNITTDSKGNIYVSEGDPTDIPANEAGQRAQKFTLVSGG